MDIEGVMRRAGGLPAAEIAGTVSARLAEHARLVVTAPPGAGKSTLLPITILEGLGTGRLLMLEPRRLAARQIAERMAWLLGEPVGRTAGYRVRFESKVSPATRLEVLTEGILTRMLVDDPTLDGVSAVVFDEFHERSLNSELALALCREIQSQLRPDLKIVIMSATIDTDSICRDLDAPLVEGNGRMFPVEILRGAEADAADAAETVAHAVRVAHRESEGDILAFLPGEADIRRCTELLGTALGETVVCPLYGMLPPDAQRRAIAPDPSGHRKVVLATPIAETSLTIENVRVVIDSGLCRKLVFDPQSSLSRLETVRVSRDMARQRTGRAGRVAAGTCYRLWSPATEARMEENRRPEILEADLAQTLLSIAAWGGTAEELPWLSAPPPAHLRQARSLLQALGAVDAAGAITSSGRKMAALPCHPRIAHMLIEAKTAEHKALAADIAALLEEKDPMSDSTSTDLSERISALRKARRDHREGRIWGRIARIAEQYRVMIHCPEDNTDPDPYAVGALVAAAYPERIAKAREDGDGRYQLAGGGLAFLDREDMNSSYGWLAVASLNAREGADGRIFLAAPLDPTDLGDMLVQRDNVSWDSRRGAVVAQRETRIGGLVVSAKPLSDIPREELSRIICEAAARDGRSMLDFSDEVGNLQRRVASVASWHPELELPDLSIDAVLARASEWLPPFLGKATNIQELKKIDLAQALWTLLDYAQQQAVDRLAPTHIVVPTGSRIRVEYRQGAELPVLRVRLQECFGLTDTPRVDDGRRPVLMELLSPGFKPVQLTQDLRSFWENTYFEVRKELRRRYPKHSWPDNPLDASPVRGTGRKNK
jgi:ATP-dependent helicase HrpB